MTDQGTHLMDVVQWFTNSGMPDAAVCQGFIAKSDGSEHPDVFSATFQYPERLVNWSLDYTNAWQNGWSILFQGDKGTMILEEFGITVYEEPWKKDAKPAFEDHPTIGLSNAEAHVQNFLDCIKTRKEPNCPVHLAAQAVSGPHLANLAYKQKKEVKLPAGYLKS
jgi:predicted dehydrogenase